MKHPTQQFSLTSRSATLKPAILNLNISPMATSYMAEKLDLPVDQSIGVSEGPSGL